MGKVVEFSGKERGMQKSVFSEATKRGHEQVVHFYYPQVGLKAIVGIHNSVLGPALGGCRMRMYSNEEQALDDCLRLSEGMTYKNSLAGLDIGGGKSVLIADSQTKEGRRDLFLKFAECLNNLAGRYITAEDMGTSMEDMMTMREISPKYALGGDPKEGGAGDPSPWTAKGCFVGIKAACERRYGSSDLNGKRVALQGVGHVGMYLVEYLVKAGAEVIVSDTSHERAKWAKEKFGCEVVDAGAIYDVKAQIFSPNAIGQTVNHETLKHLTCEIIAGGANNQLIDDSVYPVLASKGITYVPDFAINSGGVTSIAAELNSGGWSEQWVSDKVEKIYNTIHTVLEESEKRRKPTEVVAVELAKERIRQAEEVKRNAKRAANS